jgi:hypothetical protein
VPTHSSNSPVEPLANVLAGALAAALALSPRFVPPCTHQIETVAGVSMPMPCHWTFQIEFLLALAALVVAGALWIVRQAEARRVVGGVLALFALLVITVTQPWVIGLCGGSEMPCHHTARWLWLWAALLIADGVFIIARARIPTGQAAPPDPWETLEGANQWRS